jgi:hypothetical protein
MEIPMDPLDTDITSLTDVERLRALLTDLKAQHERSTAGIDQIDRLPLDKAYMRIAEKLILQISYLESCP